MNDSSEAESGHTDYTQSGVDSVLCRLLHVTVEWLYCRRRRWPHALQSNGCTVTGDGRSHALQSNGCTVTGDGRSHALQSNGCIVGGDVYRKRYSRTVVVLEAMFIASVTVERLYCWRRCLSQALQSNGCIVGGDVYRKRYSRTLVL